METKHDSHDHWIAVIACVECSNKIIDVRNNEARGRDDICRQLREADQTATLSTALDQCIEALGNYELLIDKFVNWEAFGGLLQKQTRDDVKIQARAALDQAKKARG